jgi:hypothetical protein
MDTSLDRPFVELADLVNQRLWGKYRATVESVTDDDGLGRITVKIPSVYGDETSPPAWPAVPFAGKNHGFHVLPVKGDGVWIEFEHGMKSKPIWTGCWWAKSELPKEAAAETRFMITPAGLKVILDDKAKEIRLLHGTTGEITMSDNGILIRFGSTKIELKNSGITLNNTSLKVT